MSINTGVEQIAALGFEAAITRKPEVPLAAVLEGCPGHP